MSRFSELHDAYAAAMARQHKRAAELKRVCCELHAALATFMDINPGALHLIPDRQYLDVESGQVNPPDAPFKLQNGSYSSLVVLGVGDTLLLIQLSFAFDPLANAFQVTVGRQPFDLRGGYTPLIEHLYTAAKQKFESYNVLARLIEL